MSDTNVREQGRRGRPRSEKGRMGTLGAAAELLLARLSGRRRRPHVEEIVEAALRTALPA